MKRIGGLLIAAALGACGSTAYAAQDAAPADPPPPDPVVTADPVARLEERVAADEERIAKLQEKVAWWKRLTLSGFVQPQFVVQIFDSNASPNLIDGALPPGIGPKGRSRGR